MPLVAHRGVMGAPVMWSRPRPRTVSFHSFVSIFVCFKAAKGLGCDTGQRCKGGAREVPLRLRQALANLFDFQCHWQRVCSMPCVHGYRIWVWGLETRLASKGRTVFPGRLGGVKWAEQGGPHACGVKDSASKHSHAKTVCNSMLRALLLLRAYGTWVGPRCLALPHSRPQGTRLISSQCRAPHVTSCRGAWLR